MKPGRQRSPIIFPRFEATIAPYEGKELHPSTVNRWRRGLFPKALHWMIARPETLFALYQDALERQQNTIT
jgi:hypothetical protein